MEKDNDKNYKMLLISGITVVDQVDNFVLITKLFLRFSKSKLILDYISKKQRHPKDDAKLSFIDYCTLTDELVKDTSKYFIEDHEDTLLETPIEQWLPYLTKI